MPVLTHSRPAINVSVPLSPGFYLRSGWGNRTLSNERIRFAVTTEGYASWLSEAGGRRRHRKLGQAGVARGGPRSVK